MAVPVAARLQFRAVSDEELDELILSRLRQRRAQDVAGKTRDRAVSAADLAAFFNEPESRVQDRLGALAEQGLVMESAAAPGSWTIVLKSDLRDKQHG
jgi:hypothetical protein